jgi:hypothetical protein
VRVGTYLDEAMIPIMALEDAGYSVTIASASGGPGNLDPKSNASHYFANGTDYARALQLWATMQNTVLPINALAPEAVDSTEPVSPLLDS